MKRPPGLWILLSAGVLWLSLQDVYGIRATALIFGKSTTSTTTETPANASEQNNEEKTSSSTTEPSTSSNNTDTNSTSPILTGIPQIDYIWDPNLPKELNGYNLSEYPFYERVPDEEIEFKCDGLHDGFYASVPHKCQVYHHCLFGTRYDFLCANYTAFDQKTFICQFVSEVDCVNSKKFWHRNDALYQAASTTTVAPPNLRAAIYTTASPNGADPITPLSAAPRRPPAGGGARRPYRPTRRRRPQFDYYEDEYYDDEYYDDRPRSNRGRKRPRPKPRPVYDDDYEEYEDERYESRRGGSRRRPYRDRRRNKDRRKPEYEDEGEEVDDRFEDEDFVAANKRQKNEDRHKPQLDDVEEEDRNRKRPSSEKRKPYSSNKRDQSTAHDRMPARKGNRRPVYDEYEDEVPQSDDSRSYEDRPRKKNKPNKDELTNSDGRPIIKPTTGTIYDRPRVAPRINLPVPKNAADKYSYKSISGGHSTTTTTTTAAPSVEEEYVDEEYDEPLPKRSNNRDRRPVSETKTKIEESKNQPSAVRSRTRKPDSEESSEKTSSKPKYTGLLRNRYRPSSNLKRKRPISQEYEDEEYLDEEKEVQERRPSLRSEKKSSTTTSTTTTTTSTTTTTTPEPPRKDPIMRIIKRPFLPSRGGNPYSSRGLQPVGLKAVDKSVSENNSEEQDNNQGRDSVSKEEDSDYIEDSDSREALEEKPVKEVSQEPQNHRKPVFKPSPFLTKVPVRPKYTPPNAEAQELIESEPTRQQTYKTKEFAGPRTTQKPKVIEKNPLDLNEYDVTLNDALNPTLPNLPVRSFPTGFSSASDYNYNSYSRPRYVLEPVSSNQNYVYANKVVRSHQRNEGVPQGQYSTIGGYRQPQGQTQAIYSGY